MTENRTERGCLEESQWAQGEEGLKSRPSSSHRPGKERLSPDLASWRRCGLSPCWMDAARVSTVASIGRKKRWWELILFFDFDGSSPVLASTQWSVWQQDGGGAA